MLQPRTYPELVGKALVLDADPILTLIEDDDPWVEGLFLVTCVGLLVGGAGLIGGLLTTASLPAADAVRETILQAGRQVLPLLAPAVPTESLDAFLSSGWSWGASYAGYQGGLARLFFALLTPVILVFQWLMLGLSSHIAARILGGSGSLVQTLGTTALAAAPQVLGVLTIVPFVSVSGILLGGWALLIAYRAVAITHELTWQRAVLATLALPLLLTAVLIALSAIIGTLAWVGAL